MSLQLFGCILILQNELHGLISLTYKINWHIKNLKLTKKHSEWLIEEKRSVHLFCLIEGKGRVQSLGVLARYHSTAKYFRFSSLIISWILSLNFSVFSISALFLKQTQKQERVNLNHSLFLHLIKDKIRYAFPNLHKECQCFTFQGAGPWISGQNPKVNCRSSCESQHEILLTVIFEFVKWIL